MPSTHFSTSVGRPPVSDDSDMPPKLQVLVPRTGSLQGTAAGLSAGMPTKHREVPMHEFRPTRPDSESSNVHGIHKGGLSYDSVADADRLRRDDAARRAARLRRFSKAGRGDIPLVMPLSMQLSAMDKAVRSAVEAAEDMGRHRRIDPWYDQRDERVVLPLSTLPEPPSTLSASLWSEASSSTGNNEGKNREEEKSNEEEGSSRMSAFTTRRTAAELRVSVLLQDLDTDLAEADVAAADQLLRWQTLEDDLGTAVAAIKKEIAFFRRVRTKIGDASGDMRRQPLKDSPSGLLSRGSLPLLLPSTTSGMSSIPRSKDASTTPRPPPVPFSPAIGGRDDVRAQRRLPFASYLGGKNDAVESAAISTSESGGDMFERRQGSRLNHLEKRLAKAVLTENFGLCQEIQQEIDEINSGKRDVEDEVREYETAHRQLGRRMVTAVDAEDFGACDLIKTKMGTLGSRFESSSAFSSLRPPPPPRTPATGRQRGGRPSLTDRHATLRRLEAQMAVCVEQEDFKTCAELQEIIAPLREELESEDRENDIGRSKIVVLKRQLRKAIEIEDFRACKRIQDEIDCISRAT
eukprot:g4824.t1